MADDLDICDHFWRTVEEGSLWVTRCEKCSANMADEKMTAGEFWGYFYRTGKEYADEKICDFSEAYAAHVTASLQAERDGLRRERDEVLKSAIAQHKAVQDLSSQLAEARKGLAELLSALETCHICKGLLIVEDGPMHCEDCSSDCEDHEEPVCESLYVIHQRLKQLIARSALSGSGSGKVER
jgi:hypothetical protein